MCSGRGSDDGKNALFCSNDDQHHVQGLQRGTLPDEDGGRADVGLRQQAGRIPQQTPAGHAALVGKVWPLL